uniref:NADH-ubiquinone oxidoreductase chain 4 n=1 Tax=Orcula dolium TaxID=1331962 RepID=A0A1W5IC83_9EUPU|nr:NADH dehydrogenase subunit 4 [Orcula dolium]AIR76266.1 NADH dehydrogenase subunit 4 [Orcula dolium]
MCLMFFAVTLTMMAFVGWDTVCVGVLVLLVMSFLGLPKTFSFTAINHLMMNESLGSMLIFLSAIIILLSVICTWWNKDSKYLLSLLLLNLFLVSAFSMKNLITFYFFFEASLIPTLYLIVAWGYQPERLQAGVYMILYTVLASLPLLAFLLYIMWLDGSADVFTLAVVQKSVKNSLVLVLMLAFLVKLPMYGAHLWLPKAHVEAPLSGSMVLAGVLLKLGGYGMYLSDMCFVLTSDSSWILLICFVSILGGLYASFMCFVQSDMKAMVAYSSVAHMSLIIVGVLNNTIWGVVSAKITLLAHGFTSSALFVLANMIYKKINSRSFSMSGGMLSLFPKMSLLWFLFCGINMAAPPSINLLGEMFLVPALYLQSGLMVALFVLIMFFSAGYNMLLYSSNNHGSSNNTIIVSSQYTSSDYGSLWAHILPFLLLFKMCLFYLSVEVYWLLENYSYLIYKINILCLNYSSKNLISKS